MPNINSHAEHWKLEIVWRLRRYTEPSVSFAELYKRLPLSETALSARLTELVAEGKLRVTNGQFYVPERGR